MDERGARSEEVLPAFASLRDTCPALRIVMPADLWPSIAAWDEKGDHDAFHRSICILAFERGHLGRVTAPIHRFLLAGDRPRPDLRSQYARDLREDWMFPEDALERHRRSRIFTGRIVELQCAAWLETQGWAITGLEALRTGPDIEATKEGGSFAFEVKAIGRHDEAFLTVLESLRGQPATRSPSLDAAANYVLFRAYESAKQLRRCDCGRIAVLVIEELGWHDFRTQLQEGWIDWANPSFLGSDPAWLDFLQAQRERYPHLDTELSSVIHGLDAIWIVQRLSGFEYRRELVIEMPSRASSR